MPESNKETAAAELAPETDVILDASTTANDTAVDDHGTAKMDLGAAAPNLDAGQFVLPSQVPDHGTNPGVAAQEAPSLPDVRLDAGQFVLPSQVPDHGTNPGLAAQEITSVPVVQIEEVPKKPVQPTAAEFLERANQAKLRGEKEQAQILYELACKQGSKPACWRVAFMAARRLGRDHPETQAAYEVACQLGERRACFELKRNSERQ